MTRTQILLEEPQYRWLRTQAHKQHKSLSRLLREFVDERRIRSDMKRQDDSLFGLMGMGNDRLKDVGEQHDKYLYGLQRHRNR